MRLRSGARRWGWTHFWQEPQNSLYFKANDDKLKFDNKVNLDKAYDYFSGGLLFVRLCLALKLPFTGGVALGERALPPAKHSADFLDVLLE
jgi:hypothetical protein